MPTTSREVLAEFLGTLVLIVFGVAVVAQVNLGGGSNGQYLSINIAWGLAVMMGVYVSGGVSGGHLNPAVTIAAAAFRGFPWSKVLPFIVAQTAGAFVASAIVFTTYHEALDALRWRRAAGDGGHGHGRDLRDVSAAVAVDLRRADRSDCRHGAAGGRHFRDRRPAEPCPAAAGGADRGRPARDADRRDVRVERGLCHQPRARFRAAPVHGGRRMGWRGFHGRQRLVVGADSSARFVGGLAGGFVYVAAIERPRPAEEPA